MSNPTKDISGASGTYSDDNSSVSPTGSGNSYNILGNGIFYRWTAPSDGPITVQTDPPNDPSLGIDDTVLYVLPNNTTTTPQTDDIAFNDDDHVLYSKLTFTAVGGTTYYFLVKGYDTSNFGAYILSWGNPPPPPPRDTATVVISYDGINPGGTITATISNATVGRVYEMDNWSRTGGNISDTATSSTLILTITDVSGNPGESFFVPVFNSNTGEPIGAATFDVEVASNGREFPTGINVTWDGVSQLVITYDNTIVTDISDIWTGGNWGNVTPDYSVLGTITIDNALLNASVGDSFDIEIRGTDSNPWFHDIAAFWIYPGDTTIYNSSGTIAGNLVANFTSAPTSGIYPLTVVFTNQSLPGAGGAITDNLWDFGDGTTSHDQNPTHIYTSPGTYTVSLTVTSPDGTDTKTRTDYITVRVPSTNVDCGSAISLDPNGGTMMVSNIDAPDTPAASDPFRLPYPDGPGLNDFGDVPHQFARNLWYKVTNTSSDKLFLRLVFGPWTGIAAISLYFGPCNDLKWAADFNYSNHLVPEWNVDWPNTVDPITTFFPSDGYCGNGGVWQTASNLGASHGYTLGVVTEPGQTVYIEMAGDDVSTWGSSPAAPGHGWNGSMQLTWDFHAVGFYDAIDNRLQPDSANVTPGVDGISGTVPPHTGLDYSGFDLTQYSGQSPPQLEFPCAYGYHNNHYFVAAMVITDVSDGYTASDGTTEGGASEGRDQLGIWEFDSDGTQLNFWVVFDRTHTTSLSFINSPAGEGVNDLGKNSRFCSDGTNLWLVTPLYEVVLNPYGGQFDSNAGWKYTWAPTHAAVFSFTGSGWTKIGALNAATSNTIFTNNLVGGYGSNGYIFDASASTDDPGILHVVASEWGTQDGPDGVHTGLFLHGISGTSPRQIRWQTSYAQFSPTAKLTGDIALDEFNAAAGTQADNSIGSHSSNPAFCWVRNDGGTPLLFRIKGIDQFGSPTLTDTFEIYDISSGSASLIQTIHAADMMPARPAYWDINSFPNPDQIKEGSLSDNSQFDVGNDNQRIWLLDLFVQDSTHLANHASYQVLIRIPIDNPSTFYWFENDPTKSNVGLSVEPFTFFCETKQTWIMPASFIGNLQYIRCTNAWEGFPGWKNNALSYAPFRGNGYPLLSFFNNIHDINISGDDFYFAAAYYDTVTSNISGTGYGAALAKSHILRDWLICSIDTTVASISSAALIRIYPNGDVKYVSGGLKLIKINTDGTVCHANATPVNFSIITITPSGEVKLKN